MKTETDTVENLIAEVQSRRALQPKPLTTQKWKEAVGMLKDCKESEVAFRLGAEWRTRMNSEGH